MTKIIHSMLSALSSSAVFHIPLPLCALGLFIWQSETALTDVSLHQLNTFMISASKELHNSAVACYSSCCCPFTEAHNFWRDISKCFPLYCLFSSPKPSFYVASSSLQATVNDNDFTMHSFTDRKHLPFERRSSRSTQGATLRFLKVSSTLHELKYHSVIGLWKKSSTTETQFHRLYNIIYNVLRHLKWDASKNQKLNFQVHPTTLPQITQKFSVPLFSLDQVL